jgi:hypothetical protein
VNMVEGQVRKNCRDNLVLHQLPNVFITLHRSELLEKVCRCLRQVYVDLSRGKS